jgi:hypothetical protein
MSDGLNQENNDMNQEHEQKPVSGRQQGLAEAVRRGWITAEDIDTEDRVIDPSTMTGQQLGAAEAKRRFG